MKRSEIIAYVENLGFSGVKFTAFRKHGDNGHTIQLEFGGFEPRLVRQTLGKAAKHTTNKFVFRVSRTRGIRVNTTINRLWLGDGKAIVKQMMESI